MVPRQNITSIDFEEDINEIINKIMDSGYSRIPVYEDSIDNVIGIFYTKEIIREFVKEKGSLIMRILRN
jgi:CBS domain containing-hemolysin-like protein